jgi:hypothetical protein
LILEPGQEAASGPQGNPETPSTLTLGGNNG